MTVHTPAIQACDDDDAVHCDVLVPMRQGRAFEIFRHDIYHWWPRALTWSGSVLEDLFLEGRRGGMLWERGPSGFRLDWARVMRWLPPDRIALRWHIGPGRVPQPDVAMASEVHIQFLADGARHTHVAITHHSFANHGANAGPYRHLMISPEGWPRVLACFADYCVVAENLNKFRSLID